MRPQNLSLKKKKEINQEITLTNEYTKFSQKVNFQHTYFLQTLSLARSSVYPRSYAKLKSIGIGK